jgi:hypothetical protein
MASLIEPDQLPAGDTTDDVVVGEVGVALPLQPATLTITATIGTSRKVRSMSYCPGRRTLSRELDLKKP